MRERRDAGKECLREGEILKWEDEIKEEKGIQERRDSGLKKYRI